ncbi:pectate lyase a [Phlyctema vagabunda]|uniref:Pectate lyase a n=1 Tax=Phlyctema vagabunda TaxID=108571 RepID=A0ABR4PTQ0_9HELO
MKTAGISAAFVAALLPFSLAAPLEPSATGYGAGTTGGGSATAVTVTSCSALKAAVSGTASKVIKVSGLLKDCGIMDVGSNTSILGVGASSGASGSGFRVRKGTNVIFRNLNLGPAPKKGDVLAIDESTKIWVDHCDIKSAGLVGGKDDYDGLFDASHASDFITVSWNKFHDHWKGSLIGHSDNNADEDTGKLHITYHHNSFINVNSRLPSLRFGTGHVYNSHFQNCPTSGVNSRMGANVLVESNQFDNVPLAMVTDLDSDEPGKLCDKGNVLTGTSTTRITATCSLTPPYSYSLDAVSGVAASVAANAGTGKIGL